MRRLAPLALLLAAVAFLDARPAPACPFCTAPSLTLSEQALQSDAVLLVAWKSATKGTTDRPDDAATSFVVKEALKGPLKAGAAVKIAGYQPAKVGELFLLTGLGKDVIEWDLPAEFSEAAFRYLAAAPKPLAADGSKVAPRERLPYFTKFLEFPDETVANDAYGEFSNAAYDEIVAAKAAYPRDRLRGWVLDPNTPPARIGLYGLLLGLCGDDADATAMETLIVKPVTDFRIGLDGVMGGYMLLTGGPGLDLDPRDQARERVPRRRPDGKPLLDADGKKTPVPFSEVYAAMQSIRFMWSYGGGKVSPDAAPRPRCGRCSTAPNSPTSRSPTSPAGRTGRSRTSSSSSTAPEPYQVPGIKRSIIKYFLTAAKDLPEGVSPDDASKLPEPTPEEGQGLPRQDREAGSRTRSRASASS